MFHGDREGRAAVVVAVVGVGAGPERKLDEGRAAFGHVVQQERVVAEHQPSQEKQQHRPDKREGHGGKQDKPNSGRHGIRFSDVRWARLAGVWFRTGRRGPGVDSTRGELASVSESGTPFPVITSALCIDPARGCGGPVSIEPPASAASACLPALRRGFSTAYSSSGNRPYRLVPTSLGRSMNTRNTIQPANGIKSIRNHQPLLPESWRRRIDTASPGKNSSIANPQ